MDIVTTSFWMDILATPKSPQHRRIKTRPLSHVPLVHLPLGGMPFGLCNAPTTFQRCMISTFSNIIEQLIELFMDDFYMFNSSCNDCLGNWTRVLQRWRDKNLTLN